MNRMKINLLRKNPALNEEIRIFPCYVSFSIDSYFLVWVFNSWILYLLHQFSEMQYLNFCE